MSFASGMHDDIVAIDVGPQLVTATRLELRRAVLDELERGARRLRLDFTHTGFVDSAGLGVLVSLSKQVRERGGELRIAHLNADLTLLFKLTKLDQLFRMDDGGDGPANEESFNPPAGPPPVRCAPPGSPESSMRRFQPPP